MSATQEHAPEPASSERAEAELGSSSVVSPRLLAAALVTSVAVAYANALDVAFVWDDRAVVLADPAVTIGQPLAQTFTRSFWPESDLTRAFFRPVTTLSYRFDWLVHGDNPAGYHLTNVVLHSVAALLLFAAARRLGAHALAAFAAALAWALAPRLTEAVTWISGRTDVLAAVFSFAALAVWPWGAARSTLRATAASGLVALGLLSKEVALASAVAIVAGEASTGARRDDGARGTVREAAIRLAPLAIGLVAYGALRVNALVAIEGSADGLQGLAQRLGAAATALGRYAWMFLDAFRPRLQIGLVSPIVFGFAALGGLVAVAAVAFFVMFARRVRAEALGVAVGLALAIVGIALVVHLVPIPLNVSAADRFLYFPLAGVALALACLASRLDRAHARWALALVIAFAGGGGVVTHLRNELWADELRLWLASVNEVGVDNTTPVMELGNVLFRAGSMTRALELYTIAERRLVSAPGPAHRRALANVGAALGALGRYDDALAVRRHLVATYPGIAVHSMDLARAELHALHFDEARSAISEAEHAGASTDEAKQLRRLVADVERDAASLRASSASGAVVRARFQARAGRVPEAVDAWRTVVRGSPGAATDPRELEEAAAFLARYGTVDDLRAVAARASADPRTAGDLARFRGVLALREESDAKLRAADAEVGAAVARLLR